jgi:hypothetical protein
MIPVLFKKRFLLFVSRQKLVSLDKADFPDDETFLMKIFRYFPLVSALSKESSIYRLLFPFTARTESELNSWTLTKRKASEVILPNHLSLNNFLQ